MAKVDLEVVKRILKQVDLENQVVDEILGELQLAIKEKAAEEEQPKIVPLKKQFVVIVADNEGVLAENEMVGWVFQLPEDEAIRSVKGKLEQVAKAFNASKKGKKFPVETVGELCENVPSRVFKEQKLWLKTKLPVFLVPMPNALNIENAIIKKSKSKSYNENIF